MRSHGPNHWGAAFYNEPNDSSQMLEAARKIIDTDKAAWQSRDDSPPDTGVDEYRNELP